MTDKQKAIEEMAIVMPPDIVSYDRRPNGQHLYLEQRKQIAEALVNANYGNIPQALTEFAEYLKDYVGQAQDVGYEGIGKIDIDEKLKEFLNNE